MTKRQKRLLFLYRAVGYGACGSAGALSAAKHSGIILVGFVLGLLVAFMAIAEVATRKHASEQAEHEAILARIRGRFEAMKKGQCPPPGKPEATPVPGNGRMGG